MSKKLESIDVLQYVHYLPFKDMQKRHKKEVLAILKELSGSDHKMKDMKPEEMVWGYEFEYRVPFGWIGKTEIAQYEFDLYNDKIKKPLSVKDRLKTELKSIHTYVVGVAGSWFSTRELEKHPKEIVKILTPEAKLSYRSDVEHAKRGKDIVAKEKILLESFSKIKYRAQSYVSSPLLLGREGYAINDETMTEACDSLMEYNGRLLRDVMNACDDVCLYALYGERLDNDDKLRDGNYPFGRYVLNYKFIDNFWKAALVYGVQKTIDVMDRYDVALHQILYRAGTSDNLKKFREEHKKIKPELYEKEYISKHFYPSRGRY